MKRYCLELYEPDSRHDPLVVYESDHAFLAFAAGDLVNPRTLYSGEWITPDLLRVVEVEHIVFDDQDPKHKICVYTERVSPGNVGNPEANLKKLERFFIATQLRMLEALIPGEADDLAVQREAIEEGYELQYPWLFQHLWDGLNVSQCKEVLDILDLYRAITFSAQRLEIEIDEGLWYPFPGFDGNNETSQMAYTRYFVHRLGRFQELAVNGPHTDFNSHMESLPKYRAMVERWRTDLDRTHDLSEEQITLLLETRG